LEYELQGLDFKHITAEQFDAWVRPEDMVGKN
jgi:hypothetical protein